MVKIYSAAVLIQFNASPIINLIIHYDEPMMQQTMSRRSALTLK
jgi:hypothetical protein